MLSRPIYVNTDKIFRCDVKDGLRYSVVVHTSSDTALLPKDEEYITLKERLVTYIDQYASPFFSKKPKLDAIIEKFKLRIELPTTIEPNIEYTLQWIRLDISSIEFSCWFTVIEQKSLAVISFDEPEHTGPELSEASALDFPLADAPLISLEDARQRAWEKVKKARLRAAKSLLLSEQYLKEYTELYGEPQEDYWESGDESDAI